MSSRFRMIWQQMEGQRLRYGAAIFVLVIASCLMYLVPLVPQVVMDGVLSDSPEKASGFVRKAMELAGGREFLRGHLWLAALALITLTAGAGCFTYLRSRWSAMASEAIARDLREKLYGHLQHLPCSFHDRAETGDMVQRCTSDVETFRQFLASQVVEIGRACLMLLVPLPLMLALDVRMTLVSVVILPPIVAFAVVFFRRVRSSFLLVDEAEAELTSAVQENLTGIRVVRAFARQEHEKERFAVCNARHRDLDYRVYKLMSTYWSSSDVLCMGQLALVLASGGYWLATGRLQVGTFYFFLAAVNLFTWPVRMMGRILTQLGKAMVAIGRIEEILASPKEPGPVRSAAFERSRSKGEIEQGPGTARSAEIVFDRVSFSHDPEVPVLKDVSFEAPAGRTVALLGPSGSGKSTIVNLLLRFYDPDSGEIRIDGRDIAGIDRRQVRERIAVVMQEPFLYSKTVRENIRLGRSDAGDDAIVEAATVAHVHTSILEFEDRYETLVGERGVTLSGGQRQRVALARALLDDPAILVLDDALSAVDTETEAMILEALRSRRGRQTTLVIAHRLSTLMDSDWILVLDGGRVVQQGVHEGLVEEDGLYQRLWRIQSALEDDLGEERDGDLRLSAPPPSRDPAHDDRIGDAASEEDAEHVTT